MKQLCRSLAIVLALCLLVVVYPAGAASLYQPGDVIEDFELTTTDGEVWCLSEQATGKRAVLLNFFFVDCPWCSYEFPGLEEAWSAHDDVAVIAISIQPRLDSDERINGYKADLGLTFPAAVDTIGLADRFGIMSAPTSIIIDRNGVYCLNESTQPRNGAFLRLLDAFAAEDYTEPLIGFTVPEPVVTAEAADPELLAEALNVPGMTLAWGQYFDDSWPFVVEEADGGLCARSTNAGLEATLAEVSSEVTVAAGDTVSVEYCFSGSENDLFCLAVDGMIVAESDLNDGWQTLTWTFEEDGAHLLSLVYLKYISGEVAPEAGDDCVRVRNVRLNHAGEATAYTFCFVDEQGAPVSGAVATVCSDESCVPVISDALGEAVFEGAPQVYEVHVLAVPEGYAVPETSVWTEAAYGTYQLVIPAQ